METCQVPDRFFEEHPLENMSSAMMTHLRIETKLDEELDADSVESILEPVSPAGRQAVEQEKAYIAGLVDPEEPVRMLRKGIHAANIRTMCLKIRELQESTMPLLLKRYCTSSQDRFLDVAAIAFAFVDEKWMRKLREVYEEIRDPYARANACLLFAEADMQEEIPFLMEEVRKLKLECPDRDFEQYPLLALNFLCDG